MDDKTVAKELSDTTGLDEVDFTSFHIIVRSLLLIVARRPLKPYKNQLDLMRMNNSQAVIVNDKEIKVVSEQGLK